MIEDFDIVTPDASPVIQSLRAIGYSLETAIADLIDNSLDAGAKTIKVDMIWEEEGSYVRIEDNGRGMSEHELVVAMRLGSKDPSAERGSKELGRFGMGLKTASFSLGKRLTVSSKLRGKVNVRCWDLDTVNDTNEWKLRKHAFMDSLICLDTVSTCTGTVVLIEKLDRLINPPYTGHKRNKFFRQLSILELHLRMVFHRFLSGSQKVSIILNGNVLAPWDPFYSKLQQTHELGDESIDIDDKVINIEGYVLPHHSKMNKEQYQEAKGPEGWYDQQGFYIYRNKRLLLVAGWLNLFPKEESTKLARIKIDIGQDSDFDWQIDVKKSVARPPQEVIEVLKRWGEKARTLSQKVFYHRGISETNGRRDGKKEYEIDFLWSQTTRNNRAYFQIHRENALLTKIKNVIDEDTNAMLSAYLGMLQEFCPINTFTYVPATPTKDLEEINDVDVNQIRKIHEVYQQMGIPLTKLISTIKDMPAYHRYSEQSIRQAIQGD